MKAVSSETPTPLLRIEQNAISRPCIHTLHLHIQPKGGPTLLLFYLPAALTFWGNRLPVSTCCWGMVLVLRSRGTLGTLAEGRILEGT